MRRLVTALTEQPGVDLRVDNNDAFDIQAEIDDEWGLWRVLEAEDVAKEHEGARRRAIGSGEIEGVDRKGRGWFVVLLLRADGDDFPGDEHIGDKVRICFAQP
jgi:hypothetical protein